jgi:hypothetical protein
MFKAESKPNDPEDGYSLLVDKKGILSVDELNIMRKEFRRKDRKLTREEITFINAFNAYINKKLVQTEGKGGPIHIQCWDLIHGPLATHSDVGVFTGINTRVIEFLFKEYHQNGYNLMISSVSVVLEPRDSSFWHWICCCFHEFIN